MSGSLFDFALYFFHNAKELVARGSGPYFYLPKIEHHLEARLWNDVFNFAQTYISMPLGIIRATVLIETLPAAFQMEEILFELRHHSSGLNCGRWDYIFSFIKKRRMDKSAIFPDRKDVTMEVGFMDAYVRLLIQTCHKYVDAPLLKINCLLSCYRRRVSAMGGMSAQIPIKGDEKANEVAMAKVRADKLREVKAGHDGTWIAHPLINKIAMDVFNEHMLGANQYHIRREEVVVSAADLWNSSVPGKITAQGVKDNISACVLHLPDLTSPRPDSCSLVHSPIAPPGSLGMAVFLSTSSWKMLRPQRLPAFSCGSGSSTRLASTAAIQSPLRMSKR